MVWCLHQACISRCKLSVQNRHMRRLDSTKDQVKKASSVRHRPLNNWVGPLWLKSFPFRHRDSIGRSTIIQNLDELVVIITDNIDNLNLDLIFDIVIRLSAKCSLSKFSLMDLSESSDFFSVLCKVKRGCHQPHLSLRLDRLR